MNYATKLFPNASELPGDVTVWEKTTKRTTRFSAAELDRATTFLLSAAANDDVYIGWGFQQPGGGRARIKRSAPFQGSCLTSMSVRRRPTSTPRTINFQPPGKRSWIWPWPWVFRRRQRLFIPAMEPYFQWLLDRVWVFEDHAERDRMATLSKKWQGLIIREGRKQKGWELDDTSDLARITRVPGTLNHKTKPPKRVRLLEFHDDRCFAREKLEAIVADLEENLGPVMMGKKSPGRRTRTVPSAANDNWDADDAADAKPRFDSVVAGCAWIRSTIERGEQFPEPEWYAQASIVGRCGNGEAKFHELSKFYDGYDEAQAQAKLEHALNDAGPRTCPNIHDSLGFEGCRRCPFWKQEGVSSPLQLGRVSKTTIDLLSQHVFDLSTRSYIDIRSGRRYSDRTFSDKFRHLTGDASPHGLVIAHRFTRKVEATDYLAGVRDFFVDQERGEVFNLWRPGGVAPAGGDASVIHAHLEYLMPRVEDRTHFLNALAHSLQKPGEKIKSVLLIIGKQGTGKSFWNDLIQRMFGPKNVFVAESHDLGSRFTAQMGNRQVLVLEELGIFERREVYETLKRWVTDELVTVEEKNVPRYLARTPRLMLAFSNHATPTALQEGDRRFWVCLSEAAPRSADYYDRLSMRG